MAPKVVLCADSESIRNPQIVGLEGENLEAQKWLRVFCSAVEARNYLKANDSVDEVWVASSDEVDPVNLAAAIKKDTRSRGVYLLAFQGSGSLKSRANAAGIDGFFSQKDFIDKYRGCKHQANSEVDQNNNQSAALVTAVASSPSSPLSYSPAVKAFSGKRAHVLSVVSGSGGSGKSTVAALSALFAQGLGHRTLLIDADFQFGDMKYCLGKKEPVTLEDVLQDRSRLGQLSVDGLEPALLAAPKHLEQSEAIQVVFPHILDEARTYFDLIVVNTGAFWLDQHVTLLEQSSTALFVVDQRASSLRACKHALELCSRCGIASTPFMLAVNRCARNAGLTSIDASCALQGIKAIELQEGGSEVSELLSAGMPFDLIESRNSLCLSIEQMLIDMLPENEGGKAPALLRKQPKLFKFGRRRRRVACL